MDRALRKKVLLGAGGIFIASVLLLSLPSVLTWTITYEKQRSFVLMQEEFPVTVNPKEKTITEDPLVNAYLESLHSPFQAAVGTVETTFGALFVSLATAIADLPLYHSLAATNARFVTVTAGMRKEQVANAFGKVLGWNMAMRKEFLTTPPYASLPLIEGSFAPGTYLITETTPRMVQALVNERFGREVLSRYSKETAALVPFNDALTIASLIEREAGGSDDMRLISGIIWNRLFVTMPLQIDATLQYVKANTLQNGTWWPKPLPADRFRKSPYNTYIHKGLPPAPIANPSVASILAALNPKKTSCLFYFHDSLGRFHCTDTYEEHVALLKKHYGRGK